MKNPFRVAVHRVKPTTCPRNQNQTELGKHRVQDRAADPCRCSEDVCPLATKLQQYLLGQAYFLAQSSGSEKPKSMGVTPRVITKVVSSRCDPGNQLRVLFRPLSDAKKGRLDLILREDLQNLRRHLRIGSIIKGQGHPIRLATHSRNARRDSLPTALTWARNRCPMSTTWWPEQPQETPANAGAGTPSPPRTPTRPNPRKDQKSRRAPRSGSNPSRALIRQDLSDRDEIRLPAGIAGNGIDHPDQPRNLVGLQSRSARSQQFGLVQSLSTGGHKSLDFITRSVNGRGPDDDRLFHARKGLESRLDLARPDLLAPNVDHTIDSADQHEFSAFESAHVGGRKPAALKTQIRLRKVTERC